MHACVFSDQRHKAALTPDILNCIEDCVAVTIRVTNDLHSNIWLDLIDFAIVCYHCVISN